MRSIESNHQFVGEYARVLYEREKPTYQISLKRSGSKNKYNLHNNQDRRSWYENSQSSELFHKQIVQCFSGKLLCAIEWLHSLKGYKQQVSNPIAGNLTGTPPNSPKRRSNSKQVGANPPKSCEKNASVTDKGQPSQNDYNSKYLVENLIQKFEDKWDVRLDVLMYQWKFYEDILILVCGKSLDRISCRMGRDSQQSDKNQSIDFIQTPEFSQNVTRLSTEHFQELRRFHFTKENLMRKSAKSSTTNSDSLFYLCFLIDENPSTRHSNRNDYESTSHPRIFTDSYSYQSQSSFYSNPPSSNAEKERLNAQELYSIEQCKTIQIMIQEWDATDIKFAIIEQPHDQGVSETFESLVDREGDLNEFLSTKTIVYERIDTNRFEYDSMIEEKLVSLRDCFAQKFIGYRIETLSESPDRGLLNSLKDDGYQRLMNSKLSCATTFACYDKEIWQSMVLNSDGTNSWDALKCKGLSFEHLQEDNPLKRDLRSKLQQLQESDLLFAVNVCEQARIYALGQIIFENIVNHRKLFSPLFYKLQPKWNRFATQHIKTLLSVDQYRSFVTKSPMKTLLQLIHVIDTWMNGDAIEDTFYSAKNLMDNQSDKSVHLSHFVQLDRLKYVLETQRNLFIYESKWEQDRFDIALCKSIALDGNYVILVRLSDPLDIPLNERGNLKTRGEEFTCDLIHVLIIDLGVHSEGLNKSFSRAKSVRYGVFRKGDYDICMRYVFRSEYYRENYAIQWSHPWINLLSGTLTNMCIYPSLYKPLENLSSEKTYSSKCYIENGVQIEHQQHISICDSLEFGTYREQCPDFAIECCWRFLCENINSLIKVNSTSCSDCVSSLKFNRFCNESVYLNETGYAILISDDRRIDKLPFDRRTNQENFIELPESKKKKSNPFNESESQEESLTKQNQSNLEEHSQTKQQRLFIDQQKLKRYSECCMLVNNHMDELMLIFERVLFLISNGYATLESKQALRYALTTSFCWNSLCEQELVKQPLKFILRMLSYFYGDHDLLQVKLLLVQDPKIFNELDEEELQRCVIIRGTTTLYHRELLERFPVTGKKICLIDSDEELFDLNQIFSKELYAGMVNVLKRDRRFSSLNEIVQEYNNQRRTSHDPGRSNYGELSFQQADLILFFNHSIEYMNALRWLTRDAPNTFELFAFTRNQILNAKALLNVKQPEEIRVRALLSQAKVWAVQIDRIKIQGAPRYEQSLLKKASVVDMNLIIQELIKNSHLCNLRTNPSWFDLLGNSASLARPLITKRSNLAFCNPNTFINKYSYKDIQETLVFLQSYNYNTIVSQCPLSFKRIAESQYLDVCQIFLLELLKQTLQTKKTQNDDQQPQSRGGIKSHSLVELLEWFYTAEEHSLCDSREIQGTFILINHPPFQNTSFVVKIIPRNISNHSLCNSKPFDYQKKPCNCFCFLSEWVEPIDSNIFLDFVISLLSNSSSCEQFNDEHQQQTCRSSSKISNEYRSSSFDDSETRPVIKMIVRIF